ncbi:hypothetical protein ACIBKX_23075 [Streptomyces sp. NPDC050658]|uniref:hypothetical protein n=1 Tax=unclassified Streptomyces TaxID=2593676 RepID=UPI00341A6C1F
MKRLLATGMLCAALALSVTSCSDDDDDSPREEATEAAADLCSDLSELKADNTKLRDLDPASATKEQIKDAHEDVQDGWDDVKNDLGKLDSAKKEALTNAADDLKKAYDDLPDDTTGKDALNQLQPQIKKLDETLAAASTDLKCP